MRFSKARLPLLALLVLLLVSEAAGHQKKHRNLGAKFKHSLKNLGTEFKNDLNDLHSAPGEKHDLKLVVIRETIAVIGLILCLVGSQIIKVTMFTGGFILMFVVSYLTSPSLVDTDICCGPHSNFWVRLGICAAIGVLGGLLSLFVYYVGIFTIGSLFGMIVALILLSTPLAEKEFFSTQIGVGLFYGGVMLLFGLLSLLITTTAVAIASSVGGSYATFYGIDYFAHTNFSSGIEHLVYQIQSHIKEEFGMTTPHGHHPDYFREYTVKDAVMFFFFIVLAIMGCCFQLYIAKSGKCLKESKKGCKECDCSMHQQNRGCNGGYSPRPHPDYFLDYIRAMNLAQSTDSMANKSLINH